jgi:capsule assembly protein Wzi
MVAGALTLVRLSLFALAMVAATAEARGVSPYLPVDISPEIERKIERVLILADQPSLKRPFAAATVLDALPRACDRDAVLCEDVRRFLTSLTRTAGISYASLTASGGSGADTALPNRHGMTSQSNYEAAIAAYWQPGDAFLVTGGFVSYEGETTPTGTVISVGRDFAQLDVGYRDHWWSPASDNAMLLSTQAATMPSVTISNYRPLTKAKLRYEAFGARMSESSNIVLDGGTTAGHPQLAGLHLSIEPVPGWSIGVSRIMQYGGGDREDSFGDFLDAFFNPSDEDNAAAGSTEEFGNQVASITSQLTVAEPLPMSIYFEYAGEDTSTARNFRLGNAALSAGIAFPKLGERFAATFEITEWQNAWYVHHIYRDGLRHEGHVLGHWGGDWRRLDDGVGAYSAFARLNVDRVLGGQLEATYRLLDNEDYSGGYETARQIDARYSRPLNDLVVGGEVTSGQDVFGESYSRVGVFIRF